MTSLVENSRHFEKRCPELNLTDETRRTLKANGLTSLSRYAYAVGRPGQALSTSEWNTFVNAHFATATVGEQSSLKRLLFEAQTLLLSDLREQVTQPDKWAARAIPMAERQKRMKSVRAALPDMLVDGPLEPSHHPLENTSRVNVRGSCATLF